MVSTYIDADACPVKDEIYKVAVRYQRQFVVPQQLDPRPADKLVTQIVSTKDRTSPTTGSPGAADPTSVAITADILLADRAKAGGQAIHPTGRVFTAEGHRRGALGSRGVGEHPFLDGRDHRRPESLHAGGPLSSCRRWTPRWCGQRKNAPPS